MPNIPNPFISLALIPLCLGLLTFSQSYADDGESQQPPSELSKPQQEKQSDGKDTEKEKKGEDEGEKNVLEERMDPTRLKYMRGQLAYWFKDYKAAFELWQPLAEEGHPESQATLGWLYQQGLGVKQSYETAYQWYSKSAEQDYVLAQHNMGILYENGWGVKQDYKEAAKWYKLGAEKAYGNSLYNLGRLYLEGLGVEKDKEKAIHLLKSAHQLKVVEATKVLKDLGIELKEEKPIEHTPIPQPMEHSSFRKDGAEEEK